MSGAEVAHRIAQRVRTVSSSFIQTAIPPRDEYAIDLRFLPPFVALAPDALIGAAEKILARRFSFFDLEDVDLGDPPQWNRDPLTHREAGARRAMSIDYRDERVVGNIKYLWEPNRHLHLPLLAQAHVLTGDMRYAFAIRDHVSSWIEQCPVGRGPNWVSALELGIRLINWSLTWQLIGGTRAKLFATAEGAEFRERWLRSIFEQTRMVSRNLSRFSSANNHLIGEAAGVYVASATWPMWDELRRAGERCHAVLEAECVAQNAPDGGNREQAFAYQTFVLDFLIIAGLAARARGEDFSPVYWRRIERMIDFLASMTDVAGRLPMVGDADDGYVVKLAAEAGFTTHGSLIATGAVLFERPDLATRAGTLDSKTVTLLGVKAVQKFGQLRDRRVRFRPQQQFSESGYYLLGTAFSTPDEVRLLIDAGQLGYLSLAAHGHADALALTLSIGDREILVDPGTYAYHTDPGWRAYFRGTAAHNTVMVDGRDQSEQSGKFMWAEHATARCIEFEAGGAQQHFIGEHDGYERLEDPVVHRRTVRFSADSQLIDIEDLLRCQGDHGVRRAWHFAEDAQVSRGDEGLRVVSGNVVVLLTPLEPVDRVEIHRAGTAEQGGWVSRGFGHKRPSTTVVWHSRINGQTALRTRISYKRTRGGGV
jgi:hypothetical protein